MHSKFILEWIHLVLLGLICIVKTFAYHTIQLIRHAYLIACT